MRTDRPSRADDQRHLRRSKAWSWSFLVVTYGRRILHGTLERDADSATWKTRWMERPTSMAQHTRRSRRRAAQPPHNRAFRPARSVWPDWAAPCFWEEVPWCPLPCLQPLAPEPLRYPHALHERHRRRLCHHLNRAPQRPHPRLLARSRYCLHHLAYRPRLNNRLQPGLRLLRPHLLSNHRRYGLLLHPRRHMHRPHHWRRSSGGQTIGGSTARPRTIWPRPESSPTCSTAKA